MLENLSVLIECSFGRCPTVAAVKEYITYIAQMGYKRLYLGLTDGYKIKEYPYFNYKRGGYTIQDLQEIDQWGKARGVEVVGSIQTLGHLHFLSRHEAFRELMDTRDILLANDDRVLALVEKMLTAISHGLSSRILHLGYDEIPDTGTGHYRDFHKEPLDRKVILLRHLRSVAELAQRFGYTCEIWHDMLLDQGSSVLSPEDIRLLLPQGLRVYLWDYTTRDEGVLHGMVQDLKRHCTSFGFAGAVLKDDSFCVRNNMAVESLAAQMKVCAQEGIQDFMVTTWTNGGAQCSLWATLPALFVAAEIAQGRYTPGEVLCKDRFREICSVSFDDMWALGYLDNPFEKKLYAQGNRSRWILETDILFGNYDMLLSEGTSMRYEALAKRYEAADSGRFAPLFQMQAALARVLAIKSRVSQNLRAAYATHDKAGLAAIRDGDLTDLPVEMEVFLHRFIVCWLQDSMSFGLEYNQRMFGGMLARFAYARERVNDYLEKGILIDELEGETLPPSLAPEWNEDTWADLRLSTHMSSAWGSL